MVSGSLYSAEGSLKDLATGESKPVVAFISPAKTSLYLPKQAEQAQAFLALDSSFQHPWACEAYYHQWPHFQEKFQFEDGQVLRVKAGDSLYFPTDLKKISCFEKREFLQIGSDRLDLQAFYPRRNFELLAQKPGRLVLSYRYGSNPYHPMGRCGAGEERGLLMLEIKNGRIDSSADFPLESCYRDFYFEREELGQGAARYFHYRVKGIKADQHYYFWPEQVRISRTLD